MEQTKVPIYSSERIDDLLNQNLKIIQSEEVFSFSVDAVLLSRFCSVPVRGRIVDLCSGNGVIPLLLSVRSKAHITGVEIQERLVEMARRNVRLNRLEERIEIVHEDLKQYHLQSGYGQFDLVTVNPPYLPPGSGDRNMNEHVAIARHEIKCTLEDVIAACGRLAKSGGKVAIVHRPSRLADICTYMRKYKMEPKRIRLVHPKKEAEANMVLIEAIRDGKPDLRVLPPLIVYNDQQQYCDELMEIYYGNKG
ncbi:tRNA1(Val) (adenine(37)-N6)-methyltransferase [Marinicrinis lubricantis]|uniref:tRNA1(Val) (Adenine(37)-N6)-methyltransferase n=1 Tax=Marinicrinis lubricantis TaxID=2086470 RepID=A0ABW1IQB2_9BACL